MNKQEGRTSMNGLTKRIPAFLLMVSLASCHLLPCTNPAWAQDAFQANLTSLSEQVNVPNGDKIVSLSVNNENIRNVLWRLSQQGGFNLVMDESVTGNITLEVSKVTLNQALQSIADMSDIFLLKQKGNIYLAISRQAAREKGLTRQLSKVIKLSYANAGRVADVLNRSIFGDANAGNINSGAGGQVVQKVRADYTTNSIIVVGTAREIELAEAAITKMDVMRQSKTFYLSHANALDVATLLASSIFNDGTASFRVGSGGSANTSTAGTTGGVGGMGAIPAIPSTVRVEKQDVQEGSGVNNFGSNSNGGGGSSGSASSGFSSQVTLRGFVKSSDNALVSPEGTLIVPDTRQNSVTILGTAEQIALAESMIPILDAQLPQVAIEASLIEITQEGLKELSTRVGLSGGEFQGGFNNTTSSGIGGNGIVGIPTVDPAEPEAYARSGFMYSSNPLSRDRDYAIQIRSLLNKKQAKILANPTVVATHDTESIISIVDEIVRRVTTQIDPSGFATQTIEIGEAGIVMDILPKIGEDGTVSLRLRPSVTTVREEMRDSQGNLITLLSKRDLLTQNVRLRDGETLVIGGLVHQNDTVRQDKLPIAGDLPIVGALFRASSSSSKRSELVLLITPHILSKTRPTPVNATSLNTAPMAAN
ncbi:MAG TPA: secretin N-terminal domain-containing protein [Oculatellaceae cyanobacterium]